MKKVAQDENKRTVKDFSRKEIHGIAMLYSDGLYTYHDFCDQYNASQNTFYSILSRAVVEWIVSDDVADRIKHVSAANSVLKVEVISKNGKKASNAGQRGLQAWDKRFIKREHFQFPKSEAKKIAEDYAESPLPKYDFARESYMPVRLLSQTLKRAIIFNWVSDSLVEALESKALCYNDKEKVTKFFDSLWAIRKENKRQKRK